MNEPQTSSSPATPDEQKMSVLFHTLVAQQANMALMLLGKVPHPGSGETTTDLEGARLFIDQLEMLAVKTKGNLKGHEETLLKQQLMNLRMAFVDAVSQPQPTAPASTPGSTPEKPATATEPEQESNEAEGRKKFSKKY